MITDDFQRVSIGSLWVNRETRQRRAIETPEGNFINKDGLLESVKAHGVLSPLLVHRSGEIIFGERRWTAAKHAGLADVPVRFVEDLPPIVARVIELEENARRLDLPWQDKVRAIGELHSAYTEQAEAGHLAWSQKATAEALQLNTGFISECLRVYEDLASPKLERCSSIREAFNQLSRVDERRSAEVMEAIVSASSASLDDLLGTGTEAGQGEGVGSSGAGENNAPRASVGGAPGVEPGATAPSPVGSVAYPSGSEVAPLRPQGAIDSIINASFVDWAQSYSGPRFNLIHCDFPYGVNLFGGKWGGKGSGEEYTDTVDVYEQLILALCKNLDRLMAHSAHLVFWLSADVRIMNKTLDMFAELAGDLWFWPMPLIWHKTDNMGIASDPQRRGRHVYEAALVGVREDRKICKVTSDAYGAPTDKRLHPSCKPEPVLKHFMGAFVDEHTRLLDPTCGSASSLRAAEALGAESVLGLELDPEHAKNARTAMRQFRSLRALEKQGG